MRQDDTRKERLAHLDLLKTIAILMVVTLHIPFWSVDFIAQPSVSRVIQYALRLVTEGVPLFVMVNGYLLLGKTAPDLKAHLKKTLRLFLLLIAWWVILTVVGTLICDPPRPFSLRSFPSWFSRTGPVEYTGGLWFLQSLIALYLIVPVLQRIFLEDRRLFSWLFLVVSFFTVGMSLLRSLSDCLGLLPGTDGFVFLIGFLEKLDPLGNAWFLFYFMLGGMILRHRELIARRRLLFCLIGLAGWAAAFLFGYLMSRARGSLYGVAFNYGHMFMAMFLTGLYALVLPYRDQGTVFGRIIADVGGNTFGIYLSHYLFIFFLIPHPGLFRSVPVRILIVLGVAATAHVFSRTMRKLPVIGKLFSLG